MMPKSGLADAQALGEHVRAAWTARPGAGWLGPDKCVVQGKHGTRGVSSWHGHGERHVRMLLVRREHRHADPAKDGEELRQGLRRRGGASPDRCHEGHILFTADLGIDVGVFEAAAMRCFTRAQPP